jgi:hypothetical protein
MPNDKTTRGRAQAREQAEPTEPTERSQPIPLLVAAERKALATARAP